MSDHVHVVMYASWKLGMFRRNSLEDDRSSVVRGMIRNLYSRLPAIERNYK
jgi:hypothetical protein